MVESRTHIPTIIENDVIAFTEAEHWFGYGRGLERYAVITLGAGVGYGLVIHDEVVADEDAGIGLIGHFPLDPFGPLCPAGHRGCAHSLLTLKAITDPIDAALNKRVTYEEALAMAAQNVGAARRVVQDAGRALGRLVAAVANLTMAQRIILGGEGVALPGADR
ncbi:ROK family protein [Leifsonia sp. AG29]|uniref:ROK family protein n=1 Tax=Leifsonia sp. AG29 TaxID=2598860 RepID=UPI00131E6229|nr:ROK family protein [Leifsonia sp. AG29]